ncbi:hypothetical protein Pst134EB_021846 [Puccinia striiformis f. sp. tritici]|nr:hypothetical protein Pst134EB_021846 [Puccinia striiformis f. sp. tritici]
MAKLTDLPAELIRKIIHLFVYHHEDNLNSKYYKLDHHANGDIRQKARSHLEYKESYGSTSRVFHRHEMPQASWSDAPPSNPLLSLCLVNQTFRQLAQEALFTNVALLDQWQAYLFHRTLTTSSQQERLELTGDSTAANDHHESGQNGVKSARSTAIYPPRLSKLARQVRSVEFKWMGHSSMGRGGGSLICEILQSCPLLESITIGTSFLARCKEPILEALESQRFIKEFIVLDNPNTGWLTFQWEAHEVVGRLFSKWDFLETIEFIRLPGGWHKEVEAIHKAIPTLNCALRTIILNEPSLNEQQFSMIMKSSRESLRTLQISCPTALLDRPGLCRLLKECTGPKLESLTLEVDRYWHSTPFSVRTEGADDPDMNSGLLDYVLRTSPALRGLRTLSITGPLAGPEFFILLPQSITKLSWNRCDLRAITFAEALSSWRVNEDFGGPFVLHCPQLHSSFGIDERVPWLPKLRCCSVGDTITWSTQELHSILKQLEARQVCFHPGPGRYYSANRGGYGQAR